MSATNIAASQLDGMIMSLFEKKRSTAKKFSLTPMEINSICQNVREIFLKEPCLLRVSAPITIVGDIHGQFDDLLRIFRGFPDPPETRYLFLGDYVDRGLFSLETISLLFLLKIKYKAQVHLLRGNHESASVNVFYGFQDECKRRSSIKVWKMFTDVFDCMPIAAIVGNRIFCCHGGLSPDLKDMEQIDKIKRPTMVPAVGLLCDLLWSDPDEDANGWCPNDRGCSYTFGRQIVEHFCERHNFDMVCRAHQVVEDGYEFFAKRFMVTLFSAPDYCGQFANAGAVMMVDKKLLCSFRIMEPKTARLWNEMHKKTSDERLPK